jgi:RimJ/RimL family protein N-acetyltransferase
MQIRLNISAADIDALGTWTPPSGYTLRPLDDHDEPLLPSLLAKQTVEWSEPYSPEAMREYLDQPDRRTGSFVIEHDHQIVAACFATRYDEFDPTWGICDYVWAAKDHRGQGLAGGVTGAVLRYFRRAGYRAVTLTTLDVNDDNHRLAAIKCYLKLGFRPVRTDANAPFVETIYDELSRDRPIPWWTGPTPPAPT